MGWFGGAALRGASAEWHVHAAIVADAGGFEMEKPRKGVPADAPHTSADLSDLHRGAARTSTGACGIGRGDRQMVDVTPEPASLLPATKDDEKLPP
jgi:hypothetical protein